MDKQNSLTEVRRRLVDAGGRTSQELGAGRIVGQVLMHLYLQKDPQPLDSIEEALFLSKAAISIAVRQLEQFGFVCRVRVAGDRKKYYRSTDNIGSSLQQGFLSILRQKTALFGAELDSVLNILPDAEKQFEDIAFLRQRISRAKKLQSILLKMLGNSIVNFLAKNIK